MAHSDERRCEAAHHVEAEHEREACLVLRLKGKVLAEFTLLLDVQAAYGRSGNVATDYLTEHCGLQEEINPRLEKFR